MKLQITGWTHYSQRHYSQLSLTKRWIASKKSSQTSNGDSRLICWSYIMGHEHKTLRLISKKFSLIQNRFGQQINPTHTLAYTNTHIKNMYKNKEEFFIDMVIISTQRRVFQKIYFSQWQNISYTKSFYIFLNSKKRKRI